MVHAYAYRYDLCTSTSLSWAHGSTHIGDFEVNPSLMSASVRATIPAYYYASWNACELTVNLTWSGTGGIDPEGTTTSQYTAPGVHYQARYTGAFRDAVVSGSVTGCGAQADATNSYRQDYTRLHSSSGMEFYITHPPVEAEG